VLGEERASRCVAGTKSRATVMTADALLEIAPRLPLAWHERCGGRERVKGDEKEGKALLFSRARLARPQSRGLLMSRISIDSMHGSIERRRTWGARRETTFFGAFRRYQTQG